MGQWLPQDKRHHHDWITKTVRHVDKHPKELHPVLVEFKEMVEGDSRLYMLFSNMFEEVGALVRSLSTDDADPTQ